MDLTPGALVGEKYRLVRPLASGGMGALWVARHTKLDLDVAIKFLSAEYVGSPSAEARFEREAKAAAQLKSPHVVRIHDYGVYGERPYMAMELLVGEDLCALIEQTGRMTLRRGAEIAQQIGRALTAAHDAGIVHRDLKPSNVFRSREGDGEVFKVLDFGIAKTTRDHEGHATTSGSIFGSPLYMSPEQARGTAVDHRTDLWSFGALLFEIVTGRRAFDGATTYDIIMKICNERLPVPSEVAPDLSPEVDAFFERALARDPASRFTSAREMAKAFDDLAQNAPADALPARTAAPVVDALGSTDPIVLGREGVTVPNEPASRSDAPPAIPPSSTVGGTRSRAGRGWLVFVAGAAATGVVGWLALRGGDPPSPDRTDGPTAIESGRAAVAEPAEPTPPPPPPSTAAAPASETSGAPSLPASGAAPAAPRTAAPVARPVAPSAPPSSAAPKPAPAHSVDPDFGLPVTK